MAFLTVPYAGVPHCALFSTNPTSWQAVPRRVHLLSSTTRQGKGHPIEPYLAGPTFNLLLPSGEEEGEVLAANCPDWKTLSFPVDYK